jgi:hypothetical protein
MTLSVDPELMRKIKENKRRRKILPFITGFIERIN